MSVDTSDRRSARKAWSRLDWVKELLYLCVLATEACILHPWQQWVFSSLGYKPLPFWGLLALLWVTYVIASLLTRSELTADRRQAASAGLVLLSALVAIRLHVYAGRPAWNLSWVADMVEALFNLLNVLPPDLLVLILAMVAWWRGIVASRQEADIQAVWYRFRLGVLGLLVYLILAAFGPPPEVTGLLFAFFFFGLMSIALARILELGGIHSSSMGSRQWVSVLAGAVLGSLALALLISLIFSQQTVRTVLGWFRPLVRLVERLLWILVSALVYLAWPLFEMFLNWARTVSPDQLSFLTSPLMSPLATPEEIAEQAQRQGLGPVCNTIAVVLIVVVGLLLVSLAIRRLAARRDGENQDERESLWSSGDLVNDLKDGLRRTLEQLRNLGRRDARKHRSAETIRKMYASVVDLAEEAGYPRDLAETPYEHREILYQAFPGGRAAVDAITEAYVRVHYGEVPDTREEMGQLRRHYRELQGLVMAKKAAEE
jgi:type IV secretory pathway VirB2 component (pilin)